MGCGASKTILDTTIQTTVPLAETKNPDLQSLEKTAVQPLTPESTPATFDEPTKESAEVHQREESKNLDVEKDTRGFSRNVVPSIPISETALVKQKAVTFEIPLDEELFKPTAAAIAVQTSSRPTPNSTLAEAVGALNGAKLSLPKLDLSERDILAKLANTEERWKDLERAKQESHHRRKTRVAKPKLSSQPHSKPPKHSADAENHVLSISVLEADSILLKQRLLEKEARAANRRARELSKLQAKLAKQDEHAKLVQERKKKLGKMSNENLNLSWGGEEDAEKKAAFPNAANQMKHGLDEMDNDSGKGSSAVSVNNNSRSGSGRSLGFGEDGAEIVEALR
ncbi:hypothetical protein HDU83_000234 [Entophlyctis luteolus]|nr:hypothetical protein HDU83_000234 [Entophlyctis luteolus]